MAGENDALGKRMVLCHGIAADDNGFYPILSDDFCHILGITAQSGLIPKSLAGVDVFLELGGRHTPFVVVLKTGWNPVDNDGLMPMAYHIAIGGEQL
jgi:hypothetical protein